MKGWDHVPNNMTPVEAFEYCVKNKILTHDDKINCSVGYFGIDGVGYSGYQRLSMAEIKSRPHILHWFEGFVVTWTDVLLNPYPTGLKPFEDHPQNVKDLAYSKFAELRRYTGTRDELLSITGGREFYK